MRWKEIIVEASRKAAPALLPPTPKNEQKAKAFVMRKWLETNKEWYDFDAKWFPDTTPAFVPPEDLTDGCKFSSLFASVIFGGKMVGNQDHYFVHLPNGDIFDLNREARDVKNMMTAHAAKQGEDPYRIDQFFLHQALKRDRNNVGGRVAKWLNEFCAENGLPYRFRKTSAGNFARISETKEAPTIADATENGAKGINRKMANKMVDPKGYFHPKLPSKIS